MQSGNLSLRMFVVPVVLGILAACPLGVGAADVTGVWKAEFDTQIGVQKYTFTFKQDGGLTGKASSEAGDEKHETVLTGSQAGRGHDLVRREPQLPGQRHPYHVQGYGHERRHEADEERYGYR